MALSYPNQRQTLIIPVIKRDNKYTVEIADALWNDFQVLIIKGGSKENCIIEFEVKNGS